MPTHDLHNKRPLMGIRSTSNSIHSFNDPIENNHKRTLKHLAQHKIYLCNALSVPIVISVPQKSLSIDPTRPAILREWYFFLCSAVISPVYREKSWWSSCSFCFWGCYYYRLWVARPTESSTHAWRGQHQSDCHHHQWRPDSWCRFLPDFLRPFCDQLVP